MPERDPNDIVCLVTAPNPAQAHIWAQALNDEGVQARVVGDYLDAGLGNIPGARAMVWVHRDDVGRAEAILKSNENAIGDAEQEVEA
jgi:hypothetical protein